MEHDCESDVRRKHGCPPDRYMVAHGTPAPRRPAMQASAPPSTIIRVRKEGKIMIASLFGAWILYRSKIGKVVMTICLIYFTAVNPANVSSATEPTLEETMKFLKSYLVAHSSIKDAISPLSGESVSSLHWHRKQMMVEMRSPSTSYSNQDRWFFKLNDMSTDILDYFNDGISLLCASGPCITRVEISYKNNKEVNRWSLPKIILVILDDTMAARIKSALTHAIKLSGGRAPAF